jgi:putative glutamine amidotransferase
VPTGRLSFAPMSKPIVLVPACRGMLDDHESHVVSRSYTDAVRLAGCVPLIVPAARADELAALLSIADGVLLTGSASNVHPSHFGETVHDPSLPLDADRDAWTLPLVPLALERGVPLLAICRGFQEANVALGGSLHQAVHEVAGQADHREAPRATLDVQYGEAHDLAVQPGGVLEGIAGALTVRVNSLHGQGVNRLAEGLRIEALAPDGLIEAFSMPTSRGFNLAVQWHPEWQAASNPLSSALFAAFGAACAAFHEARVQA